MSSFLDFKNFPLILTFEESVWYMAPEVVFYIFILPVPMNFLLKDKKLVVLKCFVNVCLINIFLINKNNL